MGIGYSALVLAGVEMVGVDVVALMVGIGGVGVLVNVKRWWRWR